MSVHQLELGRTIPAAPSTVRAIPVSLSSYESFVAYGSGINVVVRDLEKSGEVFLCGWHTTSVTAVRFSRTGKLVASGDQNGNLVVWVRCPNTREVLNTKQLQGPVRDIAWTGDDERLVVVGDGKSSFGVSITITGNTIGNINGHNQTIFSCDMRAHRPYRIVTGGADSMVGFYEGVPFNFKCNIRGHPEKVTCVRYSPDMGTIATVSRSSDIILLDGETGEKKECIATEHKGTIYSVAWSLDGTKIATASADKSVRIFDAKTGTLIGLCLLGDDIKDMQQGVVYTSHGIVSVSFSGKLTLISEQGEVKSTLSGHQGRVLLLHKDSNGTLVSVSVDRALIWRDAESADELDIRSSIITVAAFDEGNLYYVAGNVLTRYALGNKRTTVLWKETGNVTAIAIAEGGNVVLLGSNKFTVVDASGQKVWEEGLSKFDGCSAAAHGGTVMLGGDKLVRGYHVTTDPSPPTMSVQFLGHHTGVVACVAFSRDGHCVASGDASRNIFVWSPIDGSVLYQDLVFHTLRVMSLAFSTCSNTQLLSGSMDGSLIVWDLEAKTRRREDAAHRGGVSAVSWAEDGTLLSAGGDFCIRQWIAST